MNDSEAVNGLLDILKAHEARSDIFAKELNGIHEAWQRDMGRQIRLEAQIEALLSMVTELAVHSGLSAEHVEICFRERFLIFQDRFLTACEPVSPDLAAHIDNRPASEIPTQTEIRPLFPPSDS